MNAIGEVVHYHDVAKLADYVVLDPRWLTATILGPIFSPTTENLVGVKDRIPQSEDGTFKLDDFVRILGSPSAPLDKDVAMLVVE